MSLELSPPIVWAVIGLMLVIAEMATMTFILVFFGLSALMVAVVTGITGWHHVPGEIALFAILGIADLLALRRRIMSTWSSSRGPAMDEKQCITLSADVPAGGSAQIEYQGTTWTAVNGSPETFRRGDKAVIERMDGVKIILASEAKGK